MNSSESKYAECLYFTTNALARKVEKLAIKSWKPVNLSPSHAYLLMLVIEQPGIQPGFISDHLQLTPSTVTRLIEKLEERKLLIRTSSGKISNVYPTPRAKQAVPQLNNCVKHFINACNKYMIKADCKMMEQMHGIIKKLN